MPVVGCCCCEETKETTGLPDALEMAFALLSSGSTGVPSDEAPSGTCGGVDWQVSTAIVDLLTSVVFDYAGTTGGCCWWYSARKEYTYDADDNNTCGGVFTEPAVLFGDAPFEQDYREGSYVYEHCTEAVHLNGDGTWDECIPASPHEFCCDDCPTAAEVRSSTYEEFTGTRISYTPLVGDGGLQICVAGDMVTISGTLTMYMGVISHTGGYYFVNGGRTPGPPPDCDTGAGSFDDETTVSCSGSSTPVAEFPFSMSADLSLVSGANLWEKIKNCTTWEFDYAYGVCGGPPGCWSGGYTCVGPCDILPTSCYVGMGCQDAMGGSVGHISGDAIDQVCLYSYGTLGVTFGDAA